MAISVYTKVIDEVGLVESNDAAVSRTFIERFKTWWALRTRCEKIFALPALLTIIGILILCVGLIYLSLREPEDVISSRISREDGNFKNVATCYTPACRRAADDIIRHMDRDHDPCDDFYKFACNNFIQSAVVPSDKPSVSTFRDLQDVVINQLKLVLQKPMLAEEPDIYRKTKTYYQACMNERKIEARGSRPLRDALQRLGGWPVLQPASWNETAFDWKETTYRMRDLGFLSNRFFTFGTEVDLNNSSMTTLAVDQGSLAFQSDFLRFGFDNSFVGDYYKYAVDVAVTLGANRAFAETELKEAISMSVELAKASQTRQERRNVSVLYNPMTISEMQDKYPDIPWLEYMNRLMPESLRVTKDERVVVHDPGYITKLQEILAKYPKRVQANWLIWTSVALSIKSLSTIFLKQQTKHWRIFSGAATRPPRWQECVLLTANDMSLGVGSLYVKNFFNHESKAAAAELIDNIKTEMTKKLQQIDWMDEKTRNDAVEKAESMETHVAFAEEMLNMSTIGNHYQDVDINIDTHMENQMNLHLFNYKKSFHALRKPIRKGDWYKHVNTAAINALYHAQGNRMDIAAGILQPPFFSGDRPKYLNYGAIGFVVGHELTHGFDNIGRRFDKEGNMRNWWANGTEDMFLRKASCFVNQYDNYWVDQAGRFVNGELTQGENIADNGAVNHAYQAYVEWSKRNGEEAGLPGLPYTPRQLFWISVGNTWCVKHRTQALKPQLYIDSHSPGEFRVIGALSNSPDFASDFNCPPGSNMNPIKKCLLW